MSIFHIGVCQDTLDSRIVEKLAFEAAIIDSTAQAQFHTLGQIAIVFIYKKVKGAGVGKHRVFSTFNVRSG